MSDEEAFRMACDAVLEQRQQKEMYDFIQYYMLLHRSIPVIELKHEIDIFEYSLKA